MTAYMPIFGGVTQVDDEEVDLLSNYTWHKTPSGYAATNVVLPDGRRRVKPMHRILMKLDHGDNRVVDHINGDRLDNRKINLRVCTDSQNLMNRGAQSNNTSGFKGVSFHQGKWRAIITFQKKTKHLGYYPTPREAHEAYCLCADMLHGEFANYGEVAA
jgi:hypothetical protein